MNDFVGVVLSSEDGREEISRILGENAKYLKIRSTSKAPVSSFRPGKRNRYINVPKKGNYGIIPQGRLFVLDIDVNKGGNLLDQMQLFSELLELNLWSTFNVHTPSGGMHCYMMIPESEDSFSDIPKANLRGLIDEIRDITGRRIIVDADIRSSVTNAYVLGPGCKIESETYVLANSNPVRTISDEGFKKLVQINKQKASMKNKTKNRNAAESSSSDDIDLKKKEVKSPRYANPNDKSSTIPNNQILKTLRQSILSNPRLASYHQKRAFVKSALHCCYTSDAIAKVCIEFDINRDSYTGFYVSDYMLHRDIHNFVSHDEFHGFYCPHARKEDEPKKVEFSDKDLAVHLKKRQKRISDRQATPARNVFKKMNPRVLSYEKISRALLRNSVRKGSDSTQYQTAMMIVENFLQPLSNAGALKVLLAQSRIIEDLGLTSSQVSQGMRILRQCGVLKIRNKQKNGLAPTYIIPEYFTHKELTRQLKILWIQHQKQFNVQETLVYSPRKNSFVQPTTGYEVKVHPTALRLCESDLTFLPKIITKNEGLSAVKSYVRMERERQNSIQNSSNIVSK